MQKIILLAFIVVLTALLPAPALAQLEEITVVVDGLACPFCAYTLEKNLKQLDGVEELVIDIHLGTATLTPQAGKTIDVASVPVAIKDAGFTPREIQVSATGRIEEREDAAVLVAADGTKLFRLEPNEILSSVSTQSDKIHELVGTIVSPEEGDESAKLPLLALTQATSRTENK